MRLVKIACPRVFSASFCDHAGIWSGSHVKTSGMRAPGMAAGALDSFTCIVLIPRGSTDTTVRLLIVRLRAWLWTRHELLLPGSDGACSRDPLQRLSAPGPAPLRT